MAFTPVGSIIEGAGSIAGSLISAASAQHQMDFQERMSNTAHQRETADMKKSGINPILSGMGGTGASSPSGASFTADNPVRGLGQVMLNREVAKHQAEQMDADTQNKQKTNQLIDAQTKTQITQAALNSAAALREISTQNINKKQLDVLSAQIGQTLALTNQSNAQTKLIGSQDWRTQVQGMGDYYDATIRKVEASAYQTPFGKKVLPWLGHSADAIRTLKP